MSNFLKGTLGFKEYTVHGFRSSFRDWAGETTGHSREVIEQSLAHSLADQAEAAYQRGDYLEKRRALMADWTEYLNSSI
jgi:integrase